MGEGEESEGSAHRVDRRRVTRERKGKPRWGVSGALWEEGGRVGRVGRGVYLSFSEREREGKEIGKRPLSAGQGTQRGEEEKKGEGGGEMGDRGGRSDGSCRTKRKPSNSRFMAKTKKTGLNWGIGRIRDR